MDTSIIDLCDSDNDNNNNHNNNSSNSHSQQKAVRSQTISEIINNKTNNSNNNTNAKKKSHQPSLSNNNAQSPSSSTSSSSSSSDEELWTANSGFTTTSKSTEEMVRKGNYFKEVRRKYCNDANDDNDANKVGVGGGGGVGGGASGNSAVVNATKKKSGVASSTTNAGANRQQQYELLDSDDDEEFDEDVRNSPLVETNQAKKKKLAVENNKQDVECIEIDLSSSDNDDGCSVDQIDYPQKKSAAAAAAAATMKCQQKKKSSKDSDVDEEDSFRIRKRPFMMDDAATTTATSTNAKASSPSNTTYNYKNSYKHNNKDHDDNDDDDDDSSTTVPLPPDHDNTNEHYNTNSAYEYNTKPQQKKKKKVTHEEIDLSMDCTDDDDDDDEDGNGNVTFEVGNDHSFNDNAHDCYSSSSDDDGDKKPSHKKMAAAAAAAKKSSMRNDFIDIDSDDSSSSSSSSSSIDSSNLFTPRPIKKKTKKKKAAAAKGAQNNKKKRTSFAKDTNLNNTSDKKKKKAKKIQQCPDSAKSTISTTSSKLLTPREFSPSSTSPFGETFVANIAKQQRVPTPAIPAMSATLVQEIGGKLYPDLTHNFIIALTSQARRARHNSYQRASFDSALRSIVVIALHMRPLRSAEATGRMKGVGSNFYDLLKESVAGSKSKKPFVPKKGRYTCVAAAALVALLEMEERVQRSTSAATAASSGGDDIASTNTNGNDDASSFPMEDLITTINSLLDSRANANLTQLAQQYLNKDNLDPGWCQVKKLCSTNAAADLGGPFLKERKRKGACTSGRVFELLESGRTMAKKLRTLALSGPVEPGPLRQLPDESVDQEFGQVTMSMDFREGGGGRSLHKMCDQLDIRGVPYVVRELKIADYIFFVGEKLAPVLIERKTADDVAGSLHDGRWEKQQRSMRKAQYVLGGGSARRCQICYIIEGDASKRTVHGGNVGRRTWFQSVDDVENAIAKLPSLGFSVIRSKSNLDTIGILAKVAQDVSWKAKNGNIDVMYTYEQFLSRVKKVGDDKGDPPTDRAHQNPAPPVVVNTNFLSNNTNTAAAAAAAASNSAAADGNTDTTFTPQGNGGFDSDDDTNPQHQNNAEQVAELKKLSMARLKEMLKERDDKTGGKKEELISRLLKPRKPELLILRARRKEYVPRVPSSNAALMVALLLNHIPGTQGLTKERLMVLAEETGISKESMSGDGSSFYDGWSGIKQLQEGDPALVRREKGHRYSLTTQPPESAGVAVANALHILAHREGLCTCGNPPNGV